MAVDGIYDVVVQSPMGNRSSVLTINSDATTFKGTNAADMGTADISGSVDGDTIRWKQDVTTPMPMTLDMEARINGDALNGTVTAGGFGSFPMTGKRKA